MGICTRCQQEMTAEVGCTWRPIVVIDPYARPGSEGSLYQRIPYRARRKGVPCRDCGAPGGKLHHPGCDTERCPACRRQAISCGCWWEGDPAVESEDSEAFDE